MRATPQTVPSPALQRHYHIVLIYALVSLALWTLGESWNYYLFNLGGFYGDWITCGRWQVCIGDLFYLLSFALALSIPLRYEDMR